MSSLFNSLRHRMRQFGCADGGNVMLTFALLTVPMMGFVGSAVDYSRANSAKAAMQAAADATALMLSKDIVDPDNRADRFEGDRLFHRAAP